jgi:hypothetical protein
MAQLAPTAGAAESADSPAHNKTFVTFGKTRLNHHHHDEDTSLFL